MIIRILCVILAVEYCRELRAENKKLQKETDKMKEEISQLTAEIRYVVSCVLLVLAFAIIHIFQWKKNRALQYFSFVHCSEYQNALPTSGVELTKPSQPENTSKMFEDYIQARIMQNWKFWIVSFEFMNVFSPRGL